MALLLNSNLEIDVASVVRLPPFSTKLEGGMFKTFIQTRSKTRDSRLRQTTYTEIRTYKSYNTYPELFILNYISISAVFSIV